MPDDKVTFEPATDIDPNAWYHMTEHRIDEVDDKTFDGRLVVTDREEGTLAVLDQDQGDWQFQPVDTDDHDARYAIRNTAYSVSRQLSVCWRGDEIANGKTQPCLTDSDGTDTQKWDIARWNGTEMFRFINVGNGTDYWMDCHRGNPPFMSDNIDTSVSQPAQQWILRSMSAVDDGAFSTIFTNVCPTCRRPHHQLSDRQGLTHIADTYHSTKFHSNHLHLEILSVSLRRTNERR